MAIAALIALALGSAPAAQPPTPEASASAFLDAFRAMDQTRFDDFFAPDVMMFFPDGPFPTGRIEGREAVIAAFHSFFARVRARGRTTLNVAPLDLRVERHGEVAVVSFLLDVGDEVGRRTIVLRKVGPEWQIVHFHASTVAR